MPITLPMSAGEDAPTEAIISLSFSSTSASLSCFGRYSSSTAASASSFSASSGLPAAVYCSADSLRCLASFIIILTTSASSRLSLPPSAVLASSIADFMERTAFVLTWSWAFIAAMMSFWICSSSFIFSIFFCASRCKSVEVPRCALHPVTSALRSEATPTYGRGRPASPDLTRLAPWCKY